MPTASIGPPMPRDIHPAQARASLTEVVVSVGFSRATESTALTYSMTFA